MAEGDSDCQSAAGGTWLSVRTVFREDRLRGRACEGWLGRSRGRGRTLSRRSVMPQMRLWAVAVVLKVVFLDQHRWELISNAHCQAAADPLSQEMVSRGQHPCLNQPCR